MLQKDSDDFRHPPSNHEHLSYEEGLVVIDGFYPAPETPPPHRLIQVFDESPELPTASDDDDDDDQAPVMDDDIESMNHFHAPPEDAPIDPKSLDANPPTPHPDMPAIIPHNTSDLATQMPGLDLSDPPLKPPTNETPAAAVTARRAPPSSSKHDLHAEMRHEEVLASSSVHSTPVPFSLSPARLRAKAKRAAEHFSSPLVARQPVPKKSKTAAESPLQLFDNLPSWTRSDAPLVVGAGAGAGGNGRGRDVLATSAGAEETAAAVAAGGEVVRRPVARRRLLMGTRELRGLLGAWGSEATGTAAAAAAAGAISSPQRLTRLQRLERAAAQPGVSTKEAVRRRRQNSKK